MAEDVPVAKLLRLAKVIASRLNQPEALAWIERELNGYAGVLRSELPDYRRLHGILKWHSPYHGWLPVRYHSGKQAAEFSAAAIGESVASIEGSLAGFTSDSHCRYQWSPAVKAELLKTVPDAHDIALELTYGQMSGILHAVREKVLDWGLGLERAGVLGEGAEFSRQEQLEAIPVTNQYIIQNVGVLGDVGGAAQVSNKQSATAQLDLATLADVLQQVRSAFPSLPLDTREAIGPALAELESEASRSDPDTSKLRRLIEAAQRIAEGAAGNLAAAGIASLLGAFIR